MPFQKYGAEATLDRIYIIASTTAARVPDEVTTALERWQRLKRAAKPARPDREAVLSQVGAAMARAVRSGPVTLRHPGTVEVDSLLTPEVLDQAVAQLAREDLVADAHPRAVRYSLEVAMRVVLAQEEVLITSLQRAYGESAEAFRSAAVSLPPMFTAEMASIAKDDLAASWRTCVDTFERMVMLRSVIEGFGMPGTSDADVLGQRYLRFAKSPLVREHSPVRESTPNFGDPQTLVGHLGLARLVGQGELWCPAAPEAAALAQQLWPNEVVGVRAVM
jgi:hypothetical protein